MQNFSKLVLKWFKKYGRKDLPWQHNVSPYRTWVSEIMLQQTQVKTVIPYYIKFINSYPDINALANATVDDVLAQWTGLGYYARARNLHKTAQIIQSDFHGVFPDTLEELNDLPGIGLSTAGAILSLSMNKHAAILDGNCKRVYARFFKVSGFTGTAIVQKQLWELANHLTPKINSEHFNQAMMDLGSIVCTRSKPLCLQYDRQEVLHNKDRQEENLCPLFKNCQAYNTDTVLNYPEKKPTKKQREKSTTFVIILDNNNQKPNTAKQVFLEKREPTGIWGGLWCFPEFENQEKSLQWLEVNYPSYKILEKIKPQQHIFSHFRLNYSVLVVKASPLNKIEDSTKNNFFSLPESLQLGLATPIKNLLESINRK
jgi:A/G-specific adenine glycosylase